MLLLRIVAGNYSIGMFESSLFPGISSALSTFRQLGHVLQVVTAKPADAARAVVAHFDIERYFEAVHGPDLNDRTCNKADLVRAAGGDGPAALTRTRS